MSEEPQTTKETQTSQFTPAQKRRTVLITGGVVLAFALYLLVFLVPDVIKAASGPESMTLARAAEKATDDTTYARIEDGVWHCDTIEYVRGPSSSNRLRIVTRHTEIFLTDEGSPEQIVLFATMSGEVTCDEFEDTKLTGYLKRMNSATQRELTNEARLARFYDATDFLEMCGYCGRDNSLIGAIFGSVFAVAGVALLAFGFRMPRGD